MTHFGYHQSEEHKRKISIALMGGKRTEEQRKRMSEARIGMKFSDEHRKNIGIGHLGYCPKKETRERLSVALEGRVFSPETLAKKSGPNHWNWKGGISRYSEIISNSPEYKKWRKSIFEIDNFTCQVCGKRGVYLEPHHILRMSDYPQYIYEKENGITLCRDCHKYSYVPINKFLVYPEMEE